MGSWSQKGIWIPKLSFFGMPLREQGVPRKARAERKGEFFSFLGGNPFLVY